jgi:hypothetical protein
MEIQKQYFSHKCCCHKSSVYLDRVTKKLKIRKKLKVSEKQVGLLITKTKGKGGF